MSTITAPAPAATAPAPAGESALRAKHAHAGVAMAAATLAMGLTSGHPGAALPQLVRDRRQDRRLLHRLRPLHELRRLQPEHPDYLGAVPGRFETAADARPSSAAALGVIAVPVVLLDDPARGSACGDPCSGPGAGGAQRDRIGATPARPGDDPPALGGRRCDAARRARPLRPDRRRLPARRPLRASSPTSSPRASPASSRSAGRCWRWRWSPRRSCSTALAGRSPGASGAPCRCATAAGSCAASGWCSAGPPSTSPSTGLYVITLAFASKYGAGSATVLSYAYLFASYLVAATGFALGMSRIADMSRGVLAHRRQGDRGDRARGLPLRDPRRRAGARQR